MRRIGYLVLCLVLFNFKKYTVSIYISYLKKYDFTK